MISYTALKKLDPELYNMMKKEFDRQQSGLELIASENYASPAVLEAMSSVLANKYSEGYAGKRYYGGNEIVDEVEMLAIARAKELFHAEHVNVQSLSGSPANIAVYMAFLKPGDKVLGLRLDHGGHLSHGHPVNFSGMLYNFVHYGVDEKTGLIDMKEVREIALREKPKMIVAGFSAYSRNIDWQGFKDIATEVGAFCFADIAHIAGLIAAGELENPIPIFDVVSTTTHKTLRGPRGAMIFCKEQYAKEIDRAVFPGCQGGPHDHITAAKAVALKEAMTPEFKAYSKQTILNAKAMANRFMELGIDIVSSGTDNHLMILDLRNQGISGKELEKALEKVNISVSRSTIPNDPNPPFNPSGVRIGTPAMTTRGMKEAEAILIAELIVAVIKARDDETKLAEINLAVKDLCAKYLVYGINDIVW